MRCGTTAPSGSAATAPPTATATSTIPAHAFASSVLITAKNVHMEDHLRNLYDHLLENHYIDCIIGFDREGVLHRGLSGLTEAKRWFAEDGNRDGRTGGIQCTIDELLETWILQQRTLCPLGPPRRRGGHRGDDGCRRKSGDTE